MLIAILFTLLCIFLVLRFLYKRRLKVYPFLGETKEERLKRKETDQRNQGKRKGGVVIEEIRKNKPNGATHKDEQDYWMFKEGGWYIWLESCSGWRRIFGFKKFHDSLPIKPL